jgi:hypothetical protein
MKKAVMYIHHIKVYLNVFEFFKSIKYKEEIKMKFKSFYQEVLYY